MITSMFRSCRRRRPLLFVLSQAAADVVAAIHIGHEAAQDPRMNRAATYASGMYSAIMSAALELRVFLQS